MKKFIVLYHMSSSWMEQSKDASPEDMKKSGEEWMKWSEKCGPALLDMGSPLGGGIKLTTTGSSPSEKEVAGYSILEAEDMEAAKSLLADHPHLAYGAGCEIEVHETYSMEM